MIEPSCHCKRKKDKSKLPFGKPEITFDENKFRLHPVEIHRPDKRESEQDEGPDEWIGGEGHCPVIEGIDDSKSQSYQPCCPSKTVILKTKSDPVTPQQSDPKSADEYGTLRGMQESIEGN